MASWKRSDQSNAAEIAKRLAPFAEGDDPDVVFESHSHWAVGHLDGFSIRVFKPDGTITSAFEELCRIKAALDQYPVLNEANYSEREYQAALENYRNEIGRNGDQLPAGWESEVYSWFSDHGNERFVGNRDDQGMKTVNVQVSFAFQVPEDMATEEIYLDIPLDAIKVRSALAAASEEPVEAKVTGYRTEAVEEME